MLSEYNRSKRIIRNGCGGRLVIVIGKNEVMIVVDRACAPRRNVKMIVGRERARVTGNYRYQYTDWWYYTMYNYVVPTTSQPANQPAKHWPAAARTERIRMRNPLMMMMLFCLVLCCVADDHQHHRDHWRGWAGAEWKTLPSHHQLVEQQAESSAKKKS